MRARGLIFILAVCGLVSMAAYGVWQLINSSRATAHASLVTRNASKAEEELLLAVQPKPLRCPESLGATLRPSPQTGHHKVILTWNASAPSTDPKDQTVGYCLYRSGIQNVAQQDAKCSNCEQINQKPIAGTACVDDLVQDGARYYYVATAINGRGDPSSLSNDTLAQIPSTPQVKGAAPSYPRCRTDNGSQ